MTEGIRDMVDIRRDMVEARNQAIKTDNQIKNVILDLKAVQVRLDQVHRGIRMSSIWTNVITALSVMLAAYAINTWSIQGQRTTVLQLEQQLNEQKQQSERQVQALETDLAKLQTQQQERQKNIANAIELLGYLESKRSREAVDILQRLDFSALSELENKLLEPRVVELRKQTAESMYRHARELLTANKPEEAVEELRHVLGLDPGGKYESVARYLLGTNLWGLKRWDEALPVLRKLVTAENEPSTAEEIRFMLAVSLTRLGQREEAKQIFSEILQLKSKYEKSARAYLAAIDDGSIEDPSRTAIEDPELKPRKPEAGSVAQ